MAFGAPRFDFSGSAVGVKEGDGVSVEDGVSLASDGGEAFFLCFAEGDAEPDFFFADAVGDGEADSFSVVADFFFLCGVGVGVGVEKMLLILSLTVSWAECAAGANKKMIIEAKSARINIHAS